MERTDKINLKKTLFLTELYAPLSVGSANMFTYRFGLYPPDRVIVLTNAEENAQEFDRRVHYPIHRIPLRWNGPKGFEWLGIVWSLIKAGLPLAIQHKVDVIQCARSLPEGVAGYVIAKLLFKKLVINSHGEDISILQPYKVERFAMKTVLRAAHLNLANSAFTESLVTNLAGSHARTTIIHPGFNPDALKDLDSVRVSQMRERLSGNPILLTVGRLQQRKGQDHVIQALPKVLEHFPDLKYYIVGPTHGGTEGLAEHLQKLAKEAGVKQHVVLTGGVNSEELPYYYAASDLFIMPNRHEPGGDVEGFGIVFLEAGFLGKPVIGGKSGGVVDAVQDGETGLLVDGHSVEEIADGIVTILSNERLAKEMRQKGKEFALSMTHEKIFERYQAVMTELGL